MSVWDAEMPSIYEENMIKARKEHTCCECRGQIAKGEVYQCVNGLWDGSWDRFKTCVDCRDLRYHIAKLVKKDYNLNSWENVCAPFEQLCESVFETGFERHREYLIFRWQTNRRKRGAKPSSRNWMIRSENKAWLQVALGPKEKIIW